MTSNSTSEVRTDRSRELFRRAQEIIPGGVNSPVRAFAAVGGTPRFIERADGAYIQDVDGNLYVDFVMSWGPLIHGHAFPPVVAAIQEAASAGTSYGAPTQLELEMAEFVVASLPSVEMVRFVNSGTEAAMSAIRLARGYTSRDLIVKFAGNYHGHSDMLLAQAGSGSLTLGVPSSPGVPRGAAASTLVAPYNSSRAVGQLFKQHGTEIAAVILEPIAGNMGVVLPESEFLETVQRCTAESGALLICDEVITGFRVGLGGAQMLYGLQPDLTILGKIVGGGLPVGAYGGREDIMRQISPSGPVYQAGTLSGNPLAMAAGLASLRPLREDGFYADLASRTEVLAEGLISTAERARVPVRVNWCTGMLTMFFTDAPVTEVISAQRSDVETYGRFFHGMLEQGYYLPPSQFEAWMISSVHSMDLVERTLAAAESALLDIARDRDAGNQ